MHHDLSHIVVEAMLRAFGPGTRFKIPFRQILLNRRADSLVRVLDADDEQHLADWRPNQ